MDQNQGLNQQGQSTIPVARPGVSVPITPISAEVSHKPNKFRLFFVLLVIVIVVAVIIATIFYIKSRSGGVANQGVVNVDSSKLPTGFPSDTPLLYQIKVLQNYTTQTNGEIQATRQFTVSAPPPVLYKEYSDYFTKAGWTFVREKNTDDKSQKVTFDASKGDARATVVIDAGLSATKAGASDLPIVTLNFFTKMK